MRFRRVSTATEKWAIGYSFLIMLLPIRDHLEQHLFNEKGFSSALGQMIGGCRTFNASSNDYCIPHHDSINTVASVHDWTSTDYGFSS